MLQFQNRRLASGLGVFINSEQVYATISRQKTGVRALCFYELNSIWTTLNLWSKTVLCCCKTQVTDYKINNAHVFIEIYSLKTKNLKKSFQAAMNYLGQIWRHMELCTTIFPVLQFCWSINDNKHHAVNWQFYITSTKLHCILMLVEIMWKEINKVITYWSSLAEFWSWSSSLPAEMLCQETQLQSLVKTWKRLPGSILLQFQGSQLQKI